MIRLLKLILFLSILALVTTSLSAIELLQNGNFEMAFGPPPGWTLAEFPTSGGGTFDTAEQIDFADSLGGTGKNGLWLKPWAGGLAPPGVLVNAVLRQTVPASDGIGYTFSGWSRWEFNYPGGVATLDPSSPLGAVPSPTRTEMELAFLNSMGSVIGAPFVLDLRTEQNNFNNWVQHDFDQTFGGGSPLIAPAGTTHIRVTASMLDGIYNADPSQSAFYDDFSLMATNNPGIEILQNASLDMLAPEFPGWMVKENPDGVNTVQPHAEPFAQNTNTAGSVGAWLLPWANGGLIADPNDAILEQKVAGVPGGDYSFTGWSMFEANYAGGIETLAAGSPNGPVSSPTQTTMELAFLDENDSLIEPPMQLDLRADRVAQAGTANDGIWREHTINATAPPGTAFVTVKGAMLSGVFNVNPGQSAFFDDFSLDGPSTGGPICDFNGDDLCNGDDIDELVGVIAGGTNNPVYDLTGDNLVNVADRDAWLVAAGAENLPSGNPYLLGDANLDGTVDGQDFIDWNNNKFTAIAEWTSGDFTANGIVDGEDFIAWNNNKFTSSDSAAVPEASTSLLALVGLCLSSVGLRRRHPR